MAKQSKLDFLKQGDARTLRAAEDVLSGGQRKGFFARLAPFLGPAFIASVAYVDSGNYATNILKETGIDITAEVVRGEPAKTIIKA